MPFLALPGGISLFYELLPCLDDPTHDVASSSTSAPSSPLPSNKPTLIILSPLLCDITSRCPQATDPRIRAAFNVVCIDLRSQGRTRNEVRASYDHGVAAAEVAFAMEALRIPPSYVYAPGFVAFPVAVQLAILFPELVLGLAFAGICSVFGTPWALKSFQDLDQCWLTPKDEEDYEEALSGMYNSLFGDPTSTTAEVVDEAFGVLARRYSPKTAPQAFELMNSIHGPSNLTPEIMAAVAVPVLILQGDCHVAFSSEELAAAVDSFTGSIELESHNIVGGAPMLWTTHADIVNNYLFDFLTRRVAALPPSNVVKPLDLGYALNQAAAIARSDRIKLRNSRLPESFSQRSTEEKVERAEKIESLRKSAAECKLRIPGSTDKETWVLEAAPLTSRPRRRWRYSRRNEETPSSRGASLRQSVAERVGVAVERQEAVDLGLESESGGSTCSSLPTTPLSASPPPPSYAGGERGKPLPLEPFESLTLRS